MAPGSNNIHKRTRILPLLTTPLLLSGCAFNPGFLPGFAGPLDFGGITQLVDIINIEHAVQCEIQDFLTDKEKTVKTDWRGPDGEPFSFSSEEISSHLLAYDQPAKITLTAMTDLSGKVTATGVNLKKVGLNTVSDFITLTNNTPTLQANLQAKGEVTASPISSVPQTYDNIWRVYVQDDTDKNSKEKGPFERNFQIPPESSGSFLDAQKKIEKKINDDNLKNGKKVRLATPGDVVTSNIPPIHVTYPKTPIIRGLGNIACEIPGQRRRLFIKEWLDNFFIRNIQVEGERVKNAKGEPEYNENGTPQYKYVPGSLRRRTAYPSTAPLGIPTFTNKATQDKVTNGEPLLTSVSCDSQLTLKTQIAIIFDTSAGINPILSNTYIIPISAFAVDVSPAWTETLQIDFSLANSENNDLCEKLLARKPLGSG